MKNFKGILVVAMALMMCCSASAGLRFGVKAGLNVDKLHFNKDAFNADNRTGFTGGVMGEFMIPVVNLGVDLSVMYTRMNSRDYVTVPTSDGLGVTQKEISSGKNFIELPLNIKYKLTLPAIEKIIKPYVYTGPTFAFKLGKDTWDQIKSKTCQVAWNVGLGIELINHLQVQASYGIGMNNVFKMTGINTQDFKVKNNYWTVTAAWLF